MFENSQFCSLGAKNSSKYKEKVKNFFIPKKVPQIITLVALCIVSVKACFWTLDLDTFKVLS